MFSMNNAKILNDWLDKIAVDYKAVVPKASLNTVNTTKVVMREDGGGIQVPQYNYWLINGRKPNANQSPEAITHFVRWAGYYLFTPWVAQKGLSISPYVAAWKVAKYGYDKKINLEDVITETKKNDLLKSLSKNYITEIKLTINDIWQR